jgi:uncharacterized protein (DUF849 family)
MEKVIVTVAVTGNFHGKEANPAFPLGAREIADAVYECWNEGASIVHIHGRMEDGSPTNDPAFFLLNDPIMMTMDMIPRTIPAQKKRKPGPGSTTFPRPSR